MWSGSGCNTRDKTSDNNHTNNKTDATFDDVIPSLIASEYSDLMDGLSVSGFDLPFWLNWALQLVSVCNSWAAWYPVLSSLGRNSQKCSSIRCVWLVAAAYVQSVLGSSVHKPQLHTLQCGSHWAALGCFRLFRALWHIYWRRITETENQKDTNVWLLYNYC